MHLVPPLTGMVQAVLAWAGLVWHWGRLRLGQRGSHQTEVLADTDWPPAAL
jgi:hypothetical protein